MFEEEVFPPKDEFQWIYFIVLEKHWRQDKFLVVQGSM